MRTKLVRSLSVATLLLAGLVAFVGPADAVSSYQITFDANGGTGKMSAATVSTSGSYLPANTYLREDYKFDGWALSNNGSVVYPDGFKLRSTSNLTLFAHWILTTTPPSLLGHSIGSLIWSDNFSGPTGSKINSDNWTARNCGSSPTNGGGACFGEPQYYTPDAIRLDGSPQGFAVITTNRISRVLTNAGPCMAAPCRFTSGRFDTQGKVSFQYGYIETRMKMPVGGANWPAFWALGDSIANVGWPLSGEIDIAEQGGNRPTRNSSAVHYSYMNMSPFACCDNHRYVSSELLGKADYTTGFHTYGLAWTPNLLQFYVDRTLYYTVTPATLGQNYWVFNEPFFLILENATGPFGGSYNNWPTSRTLIDYVRVWQLDGSGTVVKH